MQARERDSQGHGLDSGTNSRESFANWSPDSSSWKTSQRCLLAGWTPYSEPWPRSGTTRNGQAFELPTWAQRIAGIGSSSSLGKRMVDTWATPSASDGLAETLSPGMGQRERGPQNLMECVAKVTWPNWPTAQAHDGMGMPGAGTRARGGRRSDLNVAVANWPTAAATDYKGSSQPGQRRGQLSEAANWPTPDAAVSNDSENLESWMARRERERAKGQNGNGMGTPLAVAARLWPTTTAGDARSSGSRSSETSDAHDGTSLTDATVRAVPTKGLKLNPAWVEQLMGFPPGWTSLAPESPSTNGKRRASSRKRKTAPRASRPSATQSSRKSPSSSGDDC